MLCRMRNTIKKHSDFQTTDDAPKFICEFFIAKARPTKWPGDARYGLVATKRTFKLAVDRNLAKRKLRAWLKICESSLNPDLDYVFIARSSIMEAALPDGSAQMKRALKKLKM